MLVQPRSWLNKCCRIKNGSIPPGPLNKNRISFGKEDVFDSFSNGSGISVRSIQTLALFLVCKTCQDAVLCAVCYRRPISQYL